MKNPKTIGRRSIEARSRAIAARRIPREEKLTGEMMKQFNKTARFAEGCGVSARRRGRAGSGFSAITDQIARSDRVNQVVANRKVDAQHRRRLGNDREVGVPIRDRGVVGVRVDRRKSIGARGLPGEIERRKPMPVKHRDRLRMTRVGMPAEQVIVKFAHFAGRVVMRDRVEIGDGQGSVRKREDDQRDQPARPSPTMHRPPKSRHVSHPPLRRTRSFYYQPRSRPGQARRRSLYHTDEL